MNIILYSLMAFIITALLSLAVTGIIVFIGTHMNKEWRDKNDAND